MRMPDCARYLVWVGYRRVVAGLKMFSSYNLVWYYFERAVGEFVLKECKLIRGNGLWK